MKPALRFACLLSLAVVFPLGCSSVETQLPIGNLCAQVPSAEYEFTSLWIYNEANGAKEPDFYSFETATPARSDSPIVDDDDLTDDYPIYLKAIEVYEAYLKQNPGVVPAVEKYESYTDEAWNALTPEERTAILAPLTDLNSAIVAICPNYALQSGRVGTLRNDQPSQGVKPRFLSCKDIYNQNGDGVVGFWNYATSKNPDDQKLAACGSLVPNTANTKGLNVWGPVSTYPQGVPGPEIPYDGFTYSGLTIPLVVGNYGQTFDVSKFEGIAFWARQATADEGLKLDSADVIAKPAANKTPADARPQDGVSQLGVILQTLDTAAFKEDPGAKTQFTETDECRPNNDASAPACSCFVGNPTAGAPAPCPGAVKFADFPAPLLKSELGGFNYKYGVKSENGLPAAIPQPFCNDYSPVDALPGQEAPFREQCWDGFRTMLEIGADWKFYMVPFSEMRQAGWGAYAESFRIDQVRSINFLASAFQATNVIVDEIALYKRR